MKALILNSGIGKRMGNLTSSHPKCMTKIREEETILSRQLGLLVQCGTTEIIMTTGPFDEILVDYSLSLNLPVNITFIKNPVYDKTNYIYSIYLAKEHLTDDDLILMHGDLVFEQSIFEDLMRQKNSSVTVSSTITLPSKDFKAVIKNGFVLKIGVEYFDNAVAAQPLYRLNLSEWKMWLDSIVSYCESGRVTCYAENALNDVLDKCRIYPLDYTDRLCSEIDTPEDLAIVRDKLKSLT